MEHGINRQIGLFSTTKKVSRPPAAHSMRPENISEFIGHQKLFNKYNYLKTQDFPSVILWGPPGSGKTTLAYILAKQSNKEFYKFSPVLGGVNDLKKLIKSAEDMKQQCNSDSLIFIDEIHRFNKAQQDALLPHVEQGTFTLIGATTEPPKVSLNNALLSRVQLIQLQKFSEKELGQILAKSNNKLDCNISSEILELIALNSNGDARKAINMLENIMISDFSNQKQIKELILENARNYDRNNNQHYDVISAFIKSMRGSDPDASLLWLAVMLDGGEDPVFIARRLIIFASEDIGNADPSALILATATLTAVKNIGMPEARINLAHATTYLASTLKSNASYLGINQALKYVQERPCIEVPDYLKNFPIKNTYKNPHNFEGKVINQKYTSEEDLPNFYSPSISGKEKLLKERLIKLKG